MIPHPTLWPAAPLTIWHEPTGSSYSCIALVWAGARASLPRLTQQLTTQVRRQGGDSSCIADEWSTGEGGGKGKPELLPRLEHHWRRTWEVHAALWVGNLPGGGRREHAALVVLRV